MAAKLIDTDSSNDLLYVKKGKVYCGYRRNYLAQNLTNMEAGLVVCKKCDGIMKQASLCNGETTCLVCSPSPKKLNPVKAIQDSIEVLEIKCPLLRDCDWKGELSEAETHLKECIFFLVRCEECEQIFPRGERDEHEKNSCPHRIFICGYCDKCGYDQDKTEHFKLCKIFPISCPNGCSAEFPRCKLSKHRSECELEEIECPYAEYGCKAKSMLRKDLLAHKKEFYIEHQDMSLVRIQQVEKENSRLKKEQIEMKWKAKAMKELDSVEWETGGLDNLEIHTSVKGPTFYVNNYMLQLFVRPSGYSVSRRKYYFYLMRIEGKFDESLGRASITHYRIVTINTRDYTKSDYTEGSMKYRLKIGSKSEEKRLSCRQLLESKHVSIRFYFDVNTEPLKSLKEKYSQDTSSDTSSEEDVSESDPFDHY